ncbi:MAG: MFS transporter [Acetobacteraceae bacterium]
MPEDRGAPPPLVPAASIEGRASWIAAGATLAILALAYGGPLIVVVDLTRIQASLGTDRSIVALASAVAWLGTGVGGILMGHLADRVGIRTIAAIGAVMMAAGLALSATGSLAALLIGHGLLMGFLGNGALYPPLVVYVSRWFERHRGTAIALISSGQYIAGMFWPTPFEHISAAIGWQAMMLAYAAFILVTVLPLVLLLLHPAPAPMVHKEIAPGETTSAGRPTLSPPAASLGAASLGAAPAHGLPGLTAGRLQALLCLASFLCCVPMAIPQAHLVAFAGSIGITPASGAAMLSVMLATAFAGRQLWGLLAERIGALPTLVLGELCQITGIALFAVTRNETALFVLAGAYGLGFSGIIPAYVLVVRELFSSADAAMRIPLLLFTSMLGMAFGTWLAGLLFDHFGSYAPAFANGVLFNLVNIAILTFLLSRWRGARRGGRGVARPAIVF